MADATMGLRYKVDADAPLNVRTLSTLLAEGDSEANRITIEMMRGGQSLSVDGMTVEGSMTRADGYEVPITGSADGNVVTAELNEYCYAVAGPFGLWLQLKSGGMRRTILLLAGYVQEKGHGEQIDVGQPLPSLDEVFAQLEEMRKVTEETKAAAGYIENATFGAVEADAPSVEATEVDGHVHLVFGLVRGEEGPAGPAGPQGNPGQDGADGRSFTVMGLYDTLSALQAAHPTGSAGDAYAVGTSTDNVIYIWDVDAAAWVAIGDLQGPAGPTGPAGPQGSPGQNGQDGQDGQDGYTPVRGVDYWTEADIETIKSYVDESILNGVW